MGIHCGPQICMRGIRILLLQRDWYGYLFHAFPVLILHQHLWPLFVHFELCNPNEHFRILASCFLNLLWDLLERYQYLDLIIFSMDPNFWNSSKRDARDAERRQPQGPQRRQPQDFSRKRLLFTIAVTGIAVLLGSFLFQKKAEDSQVHQHREVLHLSLCKSA